jgi:hypothetical protein
MAERLKKLSIARFRTTSKAERSVYSRGPPDPHDASIKAGRGPDLPRDFYRDAHRRIFEKMIQLEPTRGTRLTS